MEGEHDNDDGKSSRPRRALNYYKCRPCRAAKKKCLPVDRRWPARCERCQRLNLECAAPEKIDRYRAKSQDPDGQLIEDATPRTTPVAIPHLQANVLSENISGHEQANGRQNPGSTIVAIPSDELHDDYHHNRLRPPSFRLDRDKEAHSRRVALSAMPPLGMRAAHPLQSTSESGQTGLFMDAASLNQDTQSRLVSSHPAASQDTPTSDVPLQTSKRVGQMLGDETELARRDIDNASRPKKVEMLIDGRSYVVDLEVGTAATADGHPSRLSSESLRAVRSQVLKWDDLQFRNIEAFQFDHLPMRGHARLLRLRPGPSDNPLIECDFIDVRFDDSNMAREIASGRHQPRRTVEWAQRLEIISTQSEDSAHGRPVPYEAISWSWGRDAQDYAVMIHKGTRCYRHRVNRALALALKYLRLPNAHRTLWVDGMCIDMENVEERNSQVQLISMIFSCATQVCVWLGEDDDNSATAIQFIKDEVIKLDNFEVFAKHAVKWNALLAFMQRSWFSRRWVVQELALSAEATIYCGPDQIKWETFASAVDLCKELETSTHQLSEIIRRDERFNHVPGWFEHTSELGASLLVKAAGKVFRSYHMGQATVEEASASRLTTAHGIRRVNVTRSRMRGRQSLLSLEFLVCSLVVFEVSEPRDVIYSLLAIARDAFPVGNRPFHSPGDANEDFLLKIISTFFERKPYPVDYSRSYADCCKDFICFCIERAHASNHSRALDILCRPWAFDVRSKRLAPHTRNINMFADESISLESSGRRRGVVNANKVEMRALNEDGQHETFQQSLAHYELKWAKYLPHPRWMDEGPDFLGTPELELPSWITTASDAPFALFPHPGMQMLKMGRKNADSLVGLPQPGYGNYAASLSASVDLRMIKAKKRPVLGHYSLYVQGFILDSVEEVSGLCLNGSIPAAWADVSGWEDVLKSPPPDEFWRTLVGDRGKDGKNPPYYYARACQEAFMKGGLMSGAVNTMSLIYNERNPILAEFCRRVQSVVWNRALIRTKNGALGLVNKKVRQGDLICIIYGCSVPVILRRERIKSTDEMKAEDFEDGFTAMKTCMTNLEKVCERRARYKHAVATAQYPDMYQREIQEDTSYINTFLGHLRAQESMTVRKAQEQLWKYQEKSRKRKREREKELQRLEPNKRPREASTYSDGGIIPPNTETADEEEYASILRKEVPKSLRDDKCFYYTFLGECYVHGMMDGEAMRVQSYHSLRTHLFELR
ncbi:hypothetical protein HD806DRAFT_531888 [Xylariaceae sp. AK1471]|nr:hypothetical protein HD806DRAFT_531888 [Xylariaceae sp. AK1471]